MVNIKTLKKYFNNVAKVEKDKTLANYTIYYIKEDYFFIKKVVEQDLKLNKKSYILQETHYSDLNFLKLDRTY